MTIDELRARRKELISRKQLLQDAGADPLEVQMVSEELMDVNAALRRLSPGHRIGGRTSNFSDGSSMDGKQYRDWAGRTWSELEAAGVTWEEAESGTAKLREVVRNAGDFLTPTEKKYFELYATGKKLVEISEVCGVNKSSVSRTIALAKRKLRDAANYLEHTDSEYAGPGVRIDASDPETARMLISACTSKQIVYLYLYYGEWLSCAEIGRLLDVDKTTTLRGITRGLVSVGRMFPGKEILLDNMDALGDLALALYEERDWSEEDLTPEDPSMRSFPEKGSDWGRRLLGHSSPHLKEDYGDRPKITVRTSSGDVQDVRLQRAEKIHAPKGKLMNALLERWRSKASSSEESERGSSLLRWMIALFDKLKRITKAA